MHRRNGQTSLDIPSDCTKNIEISCLIPEDIKRQQSFINLVRRDITPHIRTALEKLAGENPKPDDPINYVKIMLGFEPAPEEELKEVRSLLELESYRHDALLSLVIHLRAQINKLEDEEKAIREAQRPNLPAAPECPLEFNPRFKEQWDKFFVPKY